LCTYVPRVCSSWLYSGGFTWRLFLSLGPKKGFLCRFLRYGNRQNRYIGDRRSSATTVPDTLGPLPFPSYVLYRAHDGWLYSTDVATRVLDRVVQLAGLLQEMRCAGQHPPPPSLPARSRAAYLEIKCHFYFPTDEELRREPLEHHSRACLGSELLWTWPTLWDV
jgi:hypothetical protein